MRNNLNRKQRKSGVASAWLVVFALGLVLFMGLVVDSGYMVLTRQELQTVADASALAGAYSVKTNAVAARTYARDIGGMNYAAGQFVDLELNTTNDISGDIVIGQYDRGTATFTPTTVSPNAVQTRARRTAAHAVNDTVNLLFGDLMGNPTVDLWAGAIAMTSGGFGAGVVALNPDVSCAFDVRGTPSDFAVNDGIIYVNSSHAEAVCHSGQPTVDTAEIRVVGGTDRNYEQVDLTGEVVYVDEPTPDPLAGLPDPPWDPADDLGDIVPSATPYEPGYYSGGLDLQNGDITLNPGIYVLDGHGLNVNGGNLYANGSIFYIVDTTSKKPHSRVDITGNGIIEMSPPDPGTYTYPVGMDVTPYTDPGVTIFQARENTHDSRILGNSNMNMLGTYYFPVSHIEIGGTADSFGNGLIADTIEVHGNGLLQIDYLGQFPPLPVQVFLVR